MEKEQTTVREGTHDFFNILEEERQHWCEVERMHDQIKEVKGGAVGSEMEQEVSWASSHARMVQQEGKVSEKKM